MGEIELKAMMVHVERIVRPVRASELRKLKIRRELLGHLQAALEEERSGGADEAAAWEAAMRRLGVPAELTRELQKAVPLVERLTIWGAPKGKWKTAWEMRLMTGVHGMKFWQVMLFITAQTILTFGWWPLVTRPIKEPASPLFWQPWIMNALIWAVCIAVLGGALMFLAFRITDAGARKTDGRQLCRLGALAVGLVLGLRASYWVYGVIAWTDFLWLPLVGIGMTAGLAWLGTFLRPGIRDIGEWLTLDIAA